jgi:outer membrane immunogenic protein
MRNPVTLAGLLAAALLAPAAAGAADLKPVYKAPPPMVVTYNWSGFYVGGHAGGAWSDFDANWDPLPSSAAFAAFPQAANLKDSAFIGGGQIGYNWQVQNWVFGVEGDWSGTDLGKDVSAPWIQNPTNVTLTDSLTTLGGSINWLASARGRAGFLAGPQLLIYATGGAAWADIDYNASAIRTSNGYNAPASFSDTVSGWVVGGGVEWLLTNNWMIRAEYLYYDFNGGNSVVAADASGNFPAFPSGYTWNDATVQVVRGGLSYKFDWGKAPVVAKY